MRQVLPSPFTDFPLALWSTAFVLDVGSRWIGPAFTFAAFCNVVFGCVIGLVALVGGTSEYNRVSRDLASRRFALVHAVLHGSALLAFSLSLWMRAATLSYGGATAEPAFFLGAAGLLFSLAAGWVGGLLSFHADVELWIATKESSATTRRPRTA